VGLVVAISSALGIVLGGAMITGGFSGAFCS